MTEAHLIAEHLAGKNLSPRDQYRVPCPAHDGDDDNLVISDKNGKTVLFCHSYGCSWENIMASIPSQLWNRGAFIPARHTNTKKAPKPLTLAANDDSKTMPEAESIWVSAQEGDSDYPHAYARKKHIVPNPIHVRETFARLDYAGGKIKEGDHCLVLKMVDEHNCFTGIQLINDEGNKIFLGCQGMMILQNNHPWTEDTTFHVVEGYATGTAVFPLYGDQDVALVAFSKTRMDTVREIFNQRIKQERGFNPKIRVHHERNNVDLWDILHSPNGSASNG